MADSMTPVQPIVTPPVSTSAPAAAVPPTSGEPVSVAASGGSSKNMIWVIVAAFVVVAVLVGVGIYMYMQLKDTNPAFQQISQNVQESFSSAENDLKGIQDPADPSTDFAAVDTELNKL